MTPKQCLTYPKWYSDLKALILCGGPGTRLRPLSCTKPKLLFPILNKPILDWTLQELSKAGVSTVVLAVNYMAEAIKRHVEKRKYGLKIVYSHEPEPLGTGGPVKYAEKTLDLEEDEELLILNGDIFADIDYSMLEKTYQDHVKCHNSIMVMALFEVDEPSSYGVVDVEPSYKILRFTEKPKEKTASRLINAGVYVTDSRIFEYLKEGRHSIEREVFPALAAKGLLFGYRHEGLWFDVGKVEGYMLANFKVLETVSRDKPLTGKNVEINSASKVLPPILIGGEVEIEAQTKIGPYVVIGNNSFVGEKCKIDHSIIFEKVRVGFNSSIVHSVIGESVNIGQKVRVGKGGVIGDYAIISNGVRLVNQVSVCPYREVTSHILRRQVYH